MLKCYVWKLLKTSKISLEAENWQIIQITGMAKHFSMLAKNVSEAWNWESIQIPGLAKYQKLLIDRAWKFSLRTQVGALRLNDLPEGLEHQHKKKSKMLLGNLQHIFWIFGRLYVTLKKGKDECWKLAKYSSNLILEIVTFENCLKWPKSIEIALGCTWRVNLPYLKTKSRK